MENRSKLELLYTAPAPRLQKDAPVMVEQALLYKDPATGNALALCQLRCLTERPIAAVLVDILCSDVWGNTTQNLENHQYLDLNTTVNCVILDEQPVLLPDKNTRKITVQVKKVLYGDGEVSRCEEESLEMPAAVTLAEHFGDEELAAQYGRNTTNSAKFVPCAHNGYWRCTCGKIYPETVLECACGCSLASAREQLDVELLTTGLEAFRQAQEEARLAEEERIRQMEAAAEEERKKQEEIFRAEEEKKKKAAKKKWAVKVFLSSLAVLLAAAALTIFVIVPMVAYNLAMNALESGDYAQAYEVFTSLGNYSDSSTMAKETRYREANGLLEGGSFVKARKIFQELGDYRDSKTMAMECDYREAAQRVKMEDFAAAYEVFHRLDNYRDSQDQELVCLIGWVSQIINGKLPVENFVQTVNLTSDQYEVYYLTLVAGITKYDDYTHWRGNYWGGTEYTDDMIALLKKLPQSYEETALLLQLFEMLRDTYSISDIFRDNSLLLQKCWNLEFIQDMAASDDGIVPFLWGYWSGSGYYIQFKEQENGGTQSYYDLPWVSEPYGTKYFDIVNMIYIYEDGNNNELAKVYQFEIVDYNTIRVFCYKNNRTYTLYR